jgi:hypothetical protein
MASAVWQWLNEHPERWIPLLGALASLLGDWVKTRWPATARVVDALMHVVPNMPAAYRALRGRPPCPNHRRCNECGGGPAP